MKKFYIDFLAFYWRIRRFLQDRRTANRLKFKEFRDLFFEQLWTSTAAKLGVEILDFGYGYFKINSNSHSTFVNKHKVMLDNHLSLQMAGNKPLVNRILKEHNYPILNYLEYDIHSLFKAFEFLQKSGRPCVVKPAMSTGAGYGITTKIKSFNQLKKASLWAATFSPKLLIEEEAEGDSYRLLYLDGKFLDAVRRNPPCVVGDGKLSVKKLIFQENQKRLKTDRIIALSPLAIDYECRLCLEHQGYTLNYVPEKGARIYVKTVVNQNSANENVSVKKLVHKSIVNTCTEIAQLFKLKLVGVDLLTPDISKPLEEVGGVINEINTTPGLQHHYLIKNKHENVPVAQSILKYILNL